MLFYTSILLVTATHIVFEQESEFHTFMDLCDVKFVHIGHLLQILAIFIFTYLMNASTLLVSLNQMSFKGQKMTSAIALKCYYINFKNLVFLK